MVLPLTGLISETNNQMDMLFEALCPLQFYSKASMLAEQKKARGDLKGKSIVHLWNILI